MGNLVNISAGGPQAGLTGDSVSPYVTGRSYGPNIAVQQTSVGHALGTANAVFLPFYIRSAVNFDGFAVQVSANETNDLDLAVYDYSVTDSDSMGAQLAAASVTSSFTLDTFTEIAFTGGSTSFSEGWVYLACSGAGGSAGPTIYGALTANTTTQGYPLMAHGSFDATGGLTGYFSDKSKYLTSVQIDSVTPGSTTFASDVSATGSNVPFIQLRIG